MMKILLVGEPSDLRFFALLKGVETVWVSTIKRRSNAFDYKTLFHVIRSLSKREYDLIVMGAYPKIKRKGFPLSILSRAWRFIKYPHSFIPDFTVKMAGDTPVVAIDLRDEPTINATDLAILNKSTLFFKRELPLDPVNAFLSSLPSLDSKEKVRNMLGGQLKKLRPISLGLVPNVDHYNKHLLSGKFVGILTTWDSYDRYLHTEKRVDLFFSGGIANQTREMGLKQVLALRQMGVNVMVPDRYLDRETFLRYVASAYLVWSPEGTGWDCFRHYEVAVVGSVPLMNRPAIFRHAPLKAGEHALYYDPEGDSLQQVVLNALKDKERLRRMGESARAFVLANHTYDALAHMVMDSVSAVTTSLPEEAIPNKNGLLS